MVIDKIKPKVALCIETSDVNLHVLQSYRVYHHHSYFAIMLQWL